MKEKFNKNEKVEQLTNMFLSRGEEKGLIVKDSFVHLFYYIVYQIFPWGRTPNGLKITKKENNREDSYNSSTN